MADSQRPEPRAPRGETEMASRRVNINTLVSQEAADAMRNHFQGIFDVIDKADEPQQQALLLGLTHYTKRMNEGYGRAEERNVRPRLISPTPVHTQTPSNESSGPGILTNETPTQGPRDQVNTGTNQPTEAMPPAATGLQEPTTDSSQPEASLLPIPDPQQNSTSSDQNTAAEAPTNPRENIIESAEPIPANPSTSDEDEAIQVPTCEVFLLPDVTRAQVNQAAINLFTAIRGPQITVQHDNNEEVQVLDKDRSLNLIQVWMKECIGEELINRITFLYDDLDRWIDSGALKHLENDNATILDISMRQLSFWLKKGPFAARTCPINQTLYHLMYHACLLLLHRLWTRTTAGCSPKQKIAFRDQFISGLRISENKLQRYLFEASVSIAVTKAFQNNTGALLLICPTLVPCLQTNEEPVFSHFFDHIAHHFSFLQPLVNHLRKKFVLPLVKGSFNDLKRFRGFSNIDPDLSLHDRLQQFDQRNSDLMSEDSDMDTDS